MQREGLAGTQHRRFLLLASGGRCCGAVKSQTSQPRKAHQHTSTGESRRSSLKASAFITLCRENSHGFLTFMSFTFLSLPSQDTGLKQSPVWPCHVLPPSATLQGFDQAHSTNTHPTAGRRCLDESWEVFPATPQVKKSSSVPRQTLILHKQVTDPTPPLAISGTTQSLCFSEFWYLCV